MANYFIRIDDAHELRRKILESSKASIHMLKGYQQLVRIRGEKAALTNDLRKELKEITVLLNRIEELTPTLSDAELAQMRGEGVKPKASRKKGKKQELPELPDEKAVFIGMPGQRPRKPKAEPEPAAEVAEAEPDEPPSLDEQLSEIEKRLKGL